MKKEKVLFMLQMQKYLNYVVSEFEIMKMLSGFPLYSGQMGLIQCGVSFMVQLENE